MSWSMPPSAGQWNPGTMVGQIAPMAAGVAPMVPAMPQDMGNYTPEQWTMMQQQNWQQWAQWQQQYAQWQTQYGDKYAMQMQAVHQMGGAPLPTQAPPPAPPPPANPPANPPPPPAAPHENDAPLFGQASAPPANSNPPNAPPGNNPWSAPRKEPARNAEALKKLAEEERLFDIQFKKWEEEIDKWKRDNVNHPDKQAYKEYEDKFETFRAQLMERRQQMNLKRAKLTGVPQGSVATNSAAVSSDNVQVPITTNSVTSQPKPNNYSKPPSYYNNQNQQDSQYYNQYQGYPDEGQSKQQSYNASGYGGNSNNAGFNQNQQRPQPVASDDNSRYGDGNNKNIAVQDRYDSYQDDGYQGDNQNYNDNSNFLIAGGSNKGIPGLDLVPEEKNAPQQVDDVIDITEDPPDAPDYTTISKGINNILGDEKIMNILNMVRGTQPPNTVQDNSNSQWNNQNNQNNQSNNKNVPYNRQNINQQNQGRMNQQPQQELQQQLQQQQQQPRNQGQGQHQQRMFNDRQGPQDQFNENNSNSPYQQGYDDQNQNYQNRGMNNMPMRPNMPIPGRPMPGPNNMQNTNFQNSNNFPQQNRNMQMVHEHNMMMSQPPPPPPPPKPQWVEEPMFTPQLVVDYDHQSLRSKVRDFIEPVHTFDYNHQSTDEYKKKDFEVDQELFSRKPRREADDIYARRGPDRYGREREPPREYEDRYREPPRDFERRPPRDERPPPRDERPPLRDERPPPRDERSRYPRDDDFRSRDDDRRRPEDRSELPRRDDRDRHGNIRTPLLYRRDEERDRRPERRDDRNRSRDRREGDRDESRRRGHSVDSGNSNHSTAKRAREVPKNSNSAPEGGSKHVVMIDDLLEMPGREMRPEKIVIILRGPPGSGKSYLAKLIRDKEAEFGSTARIMSIDDYFVQEVEVEETDPATGAKVKKPSMKYEYEEKLEDTYLNSLKRAFKRSLTDGYFPLLIYDACNDQLKSYADVWNFARQNGFQVYICTMELDPVACYKRNIHNRTLDDIQVICARWFPTPPHHIQLDPTTLLQGAAIQHVDMEDVSAGAEGDAPGADEVVEITSKWDKMDDASSLARLDGTSKPLRPSQLSMADYLQLDEWQPAQCKPGKKTVRWADIEESRQQEKMRAIGFVVGQTDWHRMTDPSKGSSALTQTKYIERVRKSDY